MGFEFLCRHVHQLENRFLQTEAQVTSSLCLFLQLWQIEENIWNLVWNVFIAIFSIDDKCTSGLGGN